MSFIRLIATCSILVLTSFSAIWSQECNYVGLYIQNNSNEIESLSIDYAILGDSGEGEAVEEGLWVVNANEGMSVEFCLPTGCYALEISGESVSSSTVYMELFQSDFIEIIDFSSEEEGVWMFTFCVENAPVFDCPEVIEYVAGEGCAWLFEIGSFQEGEEVLWEFGDGTESVWGGHFIEHEFPESGVFTVSAWFSSYDCPMGIQLDVEVEVWGCGDENPECEIEMEVSTEDGMWYDFSVPGLSEGAVFEWYVNGQLMDATGSTFEAGFDFNPYWSVCVVAYTDDCPEGSGDCYFNMGEEACPETMSMTSEGCWFLFTLDGNTDEEVSWIVDGELIEVAGNAFDINFESGGYHTVQAIYYSFECPGQMYSMVVNTEGCGDSENCNIELETDQVECDAFFIGALNIPDGVTLYWTLDGEPMDYNLMEMVYTILDEECHEIGVGYESDDCPEGVFAEVLICPDCNEDNCEIEIEVEELSSGVYLFSAVNEDGLLWGGNVNWWMDGDIVSSENPMAWTWGDVEAGVETMCVGVGPWENMCPNGGEACVELEIEAMECEEISFVLSAEVNLEVVVGLTWLINSEMGGYELEGLDLSGTLDLVLSNIGDTMTLCLPPACFELLLNFSSGPQNGLESLWGFILAGDDLLAELDLTALGEWALAFGLDPDCLSSVHLNSMNQKGWNLWPNPATDRLWFGDDLSQGNGRVTIWNAIGQCVMVGKWSGLTSSIDVGTWPEGIYIMRMEQGSKPLAIERFVIDR